MLRDDSESASSAGSRVGPPLPPRRRAVVPLVVVVSASLLLAVPLVVWLELGRRHDDRARRDFLAAYDGLAPQAALELADALPAGARQDPRVDEAVARLRERVRRAHARARAEEVLAGLAAAKTVQERIAVCDRAIVTDDTFAPAYVERARLRLRAPTTEPDQARRAALLDLNLAVEREPESALARYARACMHLGGSAAEREDARRELEQVAGLDPLGGLGSLARGRLELLAGNREAARRSLDAAVERLPDDPEPLLLRADVWLALGDAAAALRDASAAARLDPGSGLALTLRAEARWAGQGDLTGARRDLEEALGLDPQLPRALTLRAELRLGRGATGELEALPAELDLALRDVEAALRLDPALGRAHLVRAEVAAARGQLEAAIGHATRALEASPGQARAHVLRGKLRSRRGEQAAALEDFSAALRLDPSDLEALTRRAGALLRERRYDHARADLDRVLARREVPEAYLYRGVATLRANPGLVRYAQAAIEDLSRALTLAPRLGDASFHRAEAHFTLEALAPCLEDLARAEQLPATTYGRHELYYLRAQCQFQRRAWQEASTAYQRFLELAPAGDPGIALARRRLQQCQEALHGRPGEW
ncbi:MAG: tetratricopeptide repeat protein [Planctomycetes bacterium]|nr:tetratricopeptide repeat protein [Planctomycetota bacterium]